MINMKNIVLFLTISLLMIFSSCEMFIDKDITGNISTVSTKPIITLIGEPIISIKVGSEYVENGIIAGDGKDSVFNWIIEDGNVNSDIEDFYVVSYKAVNGFNWVTYAYRAVLVHDGTPYQNENIGGNYKIGFFYNSSVEKYSIDGYWKMTNVWDEEGVTFPIIFAEKQDGTLGVAPGEDIVKGRYFGTGVFTGDSIKFRLEIQPLEGEAYVKNFGWKKKN